MPLEPRQPERQLIGYRYVSQQRPAAGDCGGETRQTEKHERNGAVVRAFRLDQRASDTRKNSGKDRQVGQIKR